MSTLPPVYYNSDTHSFAYSTARTRWAKILQDAIEDILTACKNASDSETRDQGDVIRQQLSKLKDDLAGDASVAPFSSKDVAIDGHLQSFNKVLESENLTWLTGPWMFLESVLYRYINTYFRQQNKWFNYDIFANLKSESFISSVAGVSELALHYYKLYKDSKRDGIDCLTKRLLFNEFAEISLWGNATDLSLLATATLDDIKSVQGAEARKKSEANILVNDLNEAWESLSSQLDKNTKRIDFVLDNTGFELYTDLIFALILLDFKFVDKVVLHTKDIPWMVSDVNLKDFYILLTELKDVNKFPNNRKEIDLFINKVEYYNNVGILELHVSPFWTTDLDFYNISPKETSFGGAEVYEDLLGSDLVIFKGDMNYRKLTADRKWPSTTSFTDAIGPLSSSGLKILSLRTIKADVLVGLRAGLYEQITEKWGETNENKISWLYSGKYAVISYSNGEA